MSTAWSFDEPESLTEVVAPGFPPARHPAESDMFCRQAAMPDHDQGAIERAHVGVVGCGGLGGWIALALARMGCRRLTLIDHDIFDRSNAPRQLMRSIDAGRPKAPAVAEMLGAHMTNTGLVVGIQASCEAALPRLTLPVDVLVVAVDNNAARLFAARWASARDIPAIFAMLSLDGLRAQVVLQRPGGPCLQCVLPNLDEASAAPCAAASIASCWMAATHATMMVMSSLTPSKSPTWREASLDGSRENVGRPVCRASCSTCSR
jgi:molybdopterin/thiamine biosynthesis adenylyltransferase